jgi:hypothetical protein
VEEFVLVVSSAGMPVLHLAVGMMCMRGSGPACMHVCMYAFMHTRCHWPASDVGTCCCSVVYAHLSHPMQFQELSVGPG